MDLKTIILEQCKREVAAAGNNSGTYEEIKALEKAYDRIDAFYRWAAMEGYELFTVPEEYWSKGGDYTYTDAQLYALYQQSQTKSE